MDVVLDYLVEFKYLAMFGILFLCGVGLPLPEEVTLVGSGLLVGWGQAEFLPACIACVLGILAGDSIIFGLGYFFGQRFLNSGPMCFLLRPKRQEKVAKFFSKHGNKAVFFARFFAGVRIGVYAYAGSRRISWFRFLFLDFLGAMLSGPVSVWIGQWAARKFAENETEAAEKAMQIVHTAGHWILLSIAGLLICYVIFWIWRRRRSRSVARPKPVPDSPASSEGVTEESEESESESEVRERYSR